MNTTKTNLINLFYNNLGYIDIIDKETYYNNIKNNILNFTAVYFTSNLNTQEYIKMNNKIYSIVKKYNNKHNEKEKHSLKFLIDIIKQEIKPTNILLLISKDKNRKYNIDINNPDKLEYIKYNNKTPYKTKAIDIEYIINYNNSQAPKKALI